MSAKTRTVKNTESLDPAAGLERVAAFESGEDSGVLSLHGVADIFEAGVLRDAARQALEAAGPVRVDLSWAERLDLSAWQILCVLGRDVRAAGRRFEVAADIPPALALALSNAGLTL